MTGAADATTVRRTRRKGKERGQQPRQKVQYTELDPAIRAPRHGWTIVARKEFADLLLSWRFVIMIGILALAAGVAVYSTAGQLRQADVTDSASQIPRLFLFLFAPPSSVAPQGLPSFIFMFSVVGPLLGILLGFDAVSSERAEGTLPRLLSQPIHRDDVINGKFVAGLSLVALGFAVIMLLVAALGILQLGVIPSPDSILRLMSWWVIAVLYVGFWLAFALLCSVLLRSSATSALAAFGVWLLITLFAFFLVGIVANTLAPVGADATLSEQIANQNLTENLARLSPATLFQEATQAILDPTTRSLSLVTQTLQLDPSTGAVASPLAFDQSLLVIWPQAVSLIALTALAFAGAYIAFMRQEVRA